jgi:hypothetical protein
MGGMAVKRWRHSEKRKSDSKVRAWHHFEIYRYRRVTWPVATVTKQYGSGRVNDLCRVWRRGTGGMRVICCYARPLWVSFDEMIRCTIKHKKIELWTIVYFFILFCSILLSSILHKGRYHIKNLYCSRQNMLVFFLSTCFFIHLSDQFCTHTEQMTN